LRPARGPFGPAHIFCGLCRVGLKSPDVNSDSIFKAQAHKKIELFGRPIWAGPFWQLYLIQINSFITRLGRFGCDVKNTRFTSNSNQLKLIGSNHEFNQNQSNPTWTPLNVATSKGLHFFLHERIRKTKLLSFFFDYN
jgi:hypothetical protein